MFVKGARILGIACLLLAPAIVSAHHSFAAEFDQNRPVKLTGAVSKVEWLNPHAFIYVDVTDSDGKKETWGCEMGSPNGLHATGVDTTVAQDWRRGFTIEGFRAKDNSNTANSRSMVLANGQRLFAGSSLTPTP